MNWCDLITDSYRSRVMPVGIAGKPRFHAAASAAAIADAEVILGARFPASIKSLLLETDGVMELLAIDGGDWFESIWLVWPVDEVIRQNLAIRMRPADLAPRPEFDRLVFFATAGVDGILFGFPVLDDGDCAPRVVVWRPMRGRLEELAPSLEDFLRGWLTSTIAV